MNNDIEQEQKEIDPANMSVKILIGLVSIYASVFLLKLIYTTLIEAEFIGLKNFNMVFLSILMQAFPFILIGVFISSILQFLIPNELLIKVFPQKKILGFLVAIFAGVFLPICDCAIVPVTVRLIKKGISIPVAITFMLSAPLVNPIVIASTFYAFSNQFSIVYLRIIFGIIIALSIGIVISFFIKKDQIYKENTKEDHECHCNHCHCETEKIKGSSIFDKIVLVFKNTGSEFIDVGKFLIIGAFFTSIFQLIIPKDLFNKFGGTSVVSLIVMMLAAFLFSVCSTSDAFVAKSFINHFSISSIMGFLVLGPMIDIKNVLMLLSSFKKSFVLKLVLTIFVVSFIELYILTKLFM